MWQTFTFEIKQSQGVIQFTSQIYAITTLKLDNLVFTYLFIWFIWLESLI